MATLYFPVVSVELFDRERHQLEELLFTKDWKSIEKLILKKFEMLKQKKTMFVEICEEVVSDKDIPEGKKAKFCDLYSENLLKMNEFITRVQESIHNCKQTAVKNKNARDLQKQEKYPINPSKKFQRSFAKIKIAEQKAKYEVEKLNRMKLLDLRKSERLIQEQIDELEFQQRGKELEILENNLKHKKKERSSSRVLRSNEDLQQVDAATESVLEMCHNTFHRNNKMLLAQMQQQSLPEQQENKNQCRPILHKNKESKEKNMEKETSTIYYKFGWTKIDFISFRRDKIIEKCFYVSKEIELVKGTIDYQHDKDFASYSGREKIYYEIHIKLDSSIFSTSLSLKTVCKNGFKSTKEAQNSVMKNFNKDGFILSIENQEQQRDKLTENMNLSHQQVLTGRATYVVDDNQLHRNMLSTVTISENYEPLAISHPTIVKTLNYKFKFCYRWLPVFILPWTLWLENICRLENYKYPR